MTSDRKLEERLRDDAYLTEVQKQTLAVLAGAGATSASALALRLQMGRKTADARLRTLRRAGLAASHAGRYTITEQGLEALASWPVAENSSRFDVSRTALAKAHAAQHTEAFKLAISRGKRQPPRTAIGVVRAAMALADSLEMTDRQISRKLNVTGNTLSNWRHGRTAPRLMDLSCIVELAGGQIMVLTAEEAQQIEQRRKASAQGQ